MATVTVPAEFFRGELRVYSDWREAFARELLQNATDAAPSRIEVSFDSAGDHGRVSVTDDGHGMSRKVLEEVFFALGRTTKEGAGSIGGFGRARIIICFAQTSYTIHTGHLLVEGRGGEYTISEVAEYRRGCRFVIELLDPDSSRVRSAFTSLLHSCSIAVPVTIDGEAAVQRPKPARATRVLRDAQGASWARLYVSDGAGKLLVRVHGLTMFSRWLPGYDDVVLELEPARSREVLSASRDQLHTSFGAQLDTFVADLSGNRRRALRPPDGPLDVRIGGGGFLLSGAAGVSGGASREDSSGTTTVTLTPSGAAAVASAGAGWASAPRAESAGSEGGAGLGFDVFMLADTSDARVRKLARAWDPTGWDHTTGRRRRALLLGWKAAVGHAMDVLLERHEGVGQVMWTVGWTFDAETRAMHRRIGEGHVIALNPAEAGGAARFHPSQRSSRRRLLALALHEVCHVQVDEHNEAFAGLLTELHSHCDELAADRTIRAAIASA